MLEPVTRKCANSGCENQWEVRDEEDLQREVCGLCEIEAQATTGAPDPEEEMEAILRRDCKNPDCTNSWLLSMDNVGEEYCRDCQAEGRDRRPAHETADLAIRTLRAILEAADESESYEEFRDTLRGLEDGLE